MTKFFNIVFFYIITVVVVGCSQVLQTVDLKVNTEDNYVQEEFNVIKKTLTISEARKQKNAPYFRTLIQNRRGEDARPISERLALISKFPIGGEIFEYKIGTGDTINFSRLIENNRTSADTKNQWPSSSVQANYKLGIGDKLALTLIKDSNNLSTKTAGNNEQNQNLIINSQQNDDTIESIARIGSDGSVLLLEVGRLEAIDKSLNELRSEVRNNLIRNGVSPRFQLEIIEFKSQKAYLTVNSSSKVVSLNDQRITVRDILTSAAVGFKPGVITRIRLQRDGRQYVISLRNVYSENAPNIDVLAGDHIFVEDSSAKIVETSSIVDHEGNIVLEGIGKIKATGRTLDELKTTIKKLIQKVPDSQNAFQIKVTKFSSQTALLNIPGQAGGVLKITDTPALLSEVLTQKGLSVHGENITRINLQRNYESYRFSLDGLLDPNSPKIYLQAGDQIIAETLPYKEDKVFLIGGINPQIFKIKPANRETLADILFTSGGALKSSTAKRSEVYLLRGKNPVIAYHLDAQSPTRLIVADAMELRPNDILYVAEQPIISFNRTLATIIPLRILLRDIQDENIP